MNFNNTAQIVCFCIMGVIINFLILRTVFFIREKYICKKNLNLNISEYETNKRSDIFGSEEADKFILDEMTRRNKSFYETNKRKIG